MVPATSSTTTRSEPGQPVEQRGLADVGPADDRDPARSPDLGLLLGRRLGQRLQDGVEHVARAAAVQRRDRDRLPQPEVPQAVGLGLGALVVDLVGGQDDRLAGLAQDLDDRLVDVGDPDGRVDDEQHRVGERDRDLGLAGDPLGEPAGVRVPAAGVDDGEGPAVPERVVGDPVPGHAGHVLDDGLPASDDPVDQRRLADVGPADDGEHGDVEGRLGALVVGVGHFGMLVSGSRSLSLAAGIGPGSVRPVRSLAWARCSIMNSRSVREASSTACFVRGQGTASNVIGAP